MTRSNTPDHGSFRVAELSSRHPTAFSLVPDAAARAALAAELALLDLKKVTFTGEIAPEGKHGWRLSGHLGATVVQPCVVTLAPVTTRIETDVARRYLPEDEQFEAGSESEMPEDETVEPLSAAISPAAVMAEALALALPDYPRADGAALQEATFAEDGVTPMSDDDARPFASLKSLRGKLGENDG